jgi:hypothetical protein
MSGNQLGSLDALGMGYGISENDRMGFDDLTNLGLSLENARAGLAASKAAASGSKTAGIATGLGLLGAGIFCWWARAAYGEDNPKWLLFRDWVVNAAPEWFRKLYVATGPKYAHKIGRFPVVVKLLRKAMDRIIERHVSKDETSYIVTKNILEISHG